MVNLQILEELRTKEEVLNYFKQLGKEITDKELDALKQSYDKAQGSNGALTMQQLDDVAGGIFIYFHESIGLDTLRKYKLNGCDHIAFIASDQPIQGQPDFPIEDDAGKVKHVAAVEIKLSDPLSYRDTVRASEGLADQDNLLRARHHASNDSVAGYVLDTSRMPGEDFHRHDRFEVKSIKMNDDGRTYTVTLGGNIFYNGREIKIDPKRRASAVEQLINGVLGIQNRTENIKEWMKAGGIALGIGAAVAAMAVISKNN